MQAIQTKDISNHLSYLIMKTALVSFQKKPSELSAAELSKVQRQVQSQFRIESCILSSEEAKNVTLPESVLAASVEELIARYDSKEAFYQDLEDNNVDYDAFRESIRRELYVEVVMDKVASRAAMVTELDAKIYYHLHPEKFVKNEKRKISHILVTVNEEYKENTLQMARERIDAIYQTLLQKPKKFVDLALKHSECPTAMHKGLIGEVYRGTLYPELDEVAFSLKKGEISQVVQSEMGFHILRCEAITPKQTMGASEAMPKVIAFLEEKQRNNCKKYWLAQQLKQYNG